MTPRAARGMAAFCLLIALSTGVTAAVGVFARGSGSYAAATSIRGERFEYATDGVYRFNAQRVVAEGIGWDIFTLFVAVPALVAAVPAIARCSLRARVFAVGILAYFLYQYLMYAMTWAFGPLFLPFVAIYGASLAAIVWLVSTIDVPAFAARCGPGFPRRGMAILSITMAVVLTLMWLQRIVVALGDEAAGGLLLGQTTMVVQAMDLGLLVPLALFTGVMAWRGRAIGYLLSSVFVVKAVAMAAAICAMLLSAWQAEGRLEVPPLLLFGGAAAASLWLGLRMYASITPDRT